MHFLDDDSLDQCLGECHCVFYDLMLLYAFMNCRLSRSLFLWMSSITKVGAPLSFELELCVCERMCVV